MLIFQSCWYKLAPNSAENCVFALTGVCHVVMSIRGLTAHSGWATVTEVLHRGSRRPDNLQEITYLALSEATAAPLFLPDIKGVLVLRGSISLAATVRKLLWPYLQPNGAAAERRTEVPEQQAQQLRLSNDWDEPQWSHLQRNVFLLQGMNSLLDELELSVSARCFAQGSEFGTESRSDRDHEPIRVDLRVGDDVIDSNPTTADETHVNDPECRQRVAQITEDDCVVQSVLHQLHAISLVTLVQLCQWKLEFEGRPSASQNDHPKWLASIQDSCRHLPNQDLKILVTSLLDSMSCANPKSSQEINVMWEKHAMTHFNGRMLPGCCHLGCNNFEGVSEAALKTQLCSGCRKARYCSVGCQRAAWREGGHSTVCGYS